MDFICWNLFISLHKFKKRLNAYFFISAWNKNIMHLDHQQWELMQNQTHVTYGHHISFVLAEFGKLFSYNLEGKGDCLRSSMHCVKMYIPQEIFRDASNNNVKYCSKCIYIIIICAVRVLNRKT